MSLEHLTEEYARQSQTLREGVQGYQNMVMVSHMRPDADSLSTLLLYGRSFKEINPEIQIHYFIDKRGLHPDCQQLLNHYKLDMFKDISEELPASYDALLLVDTSRSGMPALPKNVEFTGAEVHCRDHHNKGNGFEYQSKIVDDSFKACVTLAAHEFSDLKTVQDMGKDPVLSTLGYQAIKVDTGRFRNMSPRDKKVKQVFAGGEMDDYLLEQIDRTPLTDKEADIFSRLYSSMERHHIKGFSTHCYVGVIESDNDTILAKVADEMLYGLQTSQDNGVAMAVFKNDETQENRFVIKTRSKKPTDRANAASFANLFRDGNEERNGGGDPNKGHAEKDLGILHYSVSSQAFKDLLIEEIGSVLMGSPMYQSDSVEKPVKAVYERRKPFTEIDLHRIEDYEQHRNILGKIEHTNLRSNGKLQSLAINLYEDMKERSLSLREIDIPSILKINNELIEAWGNKPFPDVEANVVYGLIDKFVHPYLFGLYCCKAEVHDTEETHELITNLFGPHPVEQERFRHTYDGKECGITLVKSPIMELRYAGESVLLNQCLNIEMKARLKRVVG
ncbi:MAG: DHH family phosphoesterase [Nanobdellota archaeon]